jgi:hypothetical protein
VSRFGHRGGAGRRLFAAFATAIAALLLLAARAEAFAYYSVAECGWRIGADASWVNSTGNSDHFLRDESCVPPPDRDAWDGTKIAVRTRRSDATTLSGAVARWRWTAPQGAAIVAVRGNWWRALHGGFMQRLTVVKDSGNAEHIASSRATDETPHGFQGPGWGESWRSFESRLVCAVPDGQRCQQDQVSYGAVSGLYMTLRDDSDPQATASGDLVSGAWQRGTRALDFAASDHGSGVRISQTEVDGAIARTSRHACDTRTIGSELVGTAMRPCAAADTGTHQIDTAVFSDGTHTVRQCATDFAGNRACASPAQIRVDNTAPAAPLDLAVDGGDGWRSANDFDLTWSLPDQGDGAPIAGAGYRVVSGDGTYDSGPRLLSRPGISRIADLTVPGAGTYRVSVWLRDEAGNDDPGTARTELLRLDNVAPRLAFANEQDPAHPEYIRVPVSDALSGVAGGRVSYRPQGASTWTELSTELHEAQGDGSPDELVARFPSDDLDPGMYEFRAEALDAAGNQAMTVDRADGSQMFLRNPVKVETALGARIRTVTRRCVRRFGRRTCRTRVLRSTRATVPYGAGARLVGRLSTAGGRPLARHQVVIRSAPRPGAAVGPTETATTTDEDGRYALQLPPGPSRTVAVRFAGSDTLTRATADRVHLFSRAKSSLGITPLRVLNRERILVRGYVAHRGATIPDEGKIVAIQYYDTQRRRWRPVELLRTDRSGSFQFYYRFLYITSPARIKFRAVVVAEAGWPYAVGVSPRREVTVYPE